MNYINLMPLQRNSLRNILRRWGIKYETKKVKIKRIDGKFITSKVADIKDEHIDKCINLISNHSNKRKDGTCKLLENRETLKILKRLKGLK